LLVNRALRKKALWGKVTPRNQASPEKVASPNEASPEKVARSNEALPENDARSNNTLLWKVAPSNVASTADMSLRFRSTRVAAVRSRRMSGQKLSSEEASML
jgi:hypothetical protein